MMNRSRVKRMLVEPMTWFLTFEAVYVLFLFSGRLRRAEWLQWLPVDVSLLLLATTLVLFAIVVRGAHARLSPAARAFLFSGMAFFNYAVLSLLWSPGVVYAGEKAADLVVWGLLPLIISTVVVASDAVRLERFFLVVAGFATVMSASTVYSFIVSEGIGHFTVWGGRYPGVGRTVGLGVLIALAYAIRNRAGEGASRSSMNRFTTARLTWAAVAAVGTVAMLVSGARGPLLVLSAVAVFLVLASGRGPGRSTSRLRWAVAIVLLAVLLTLGVWYLATVEQPPHFVYRYMQLFTEGFRSEGVELRVSAYFEAVSIWTLAPFFGNGLGSYPIMAGVADERHHPHNLILETGAELGLVGLLLLGLMIVLGVRAMNASSARRPVRSLILALFLFTAGIALMSGDLSDNRMMFAVLGLFPLFVSTEGMRPSARCVHVTTVHSAVDVRIRRRECASLERAGYEVYLLATAPAGSLEDGVTVITMPERHRVFRMVVSTIQAYALTSGLKADLYHLHDPELIPAGLLLKANGYRVIMDLHENTVEQIKDKPWIPTMFRPFVSRLYGVLEGVALRRFDGVVVAVPPIAQHVSGVRPTVVQNFPVPEWFDCDRSYETRENVVVYHGGISRARGIGEMLTAMELLDDVRVDLALAGTFQPASLEAQARRHCGWKRVRYLGWLDHEDVAALLSRAKAGIVTLHPTGNYYESWPVKLFEYMAGGLPVIASDFPVWREIIASSGCGILVDPSDPEKIARAIRLIIENPDEARIMGRRGRLAVEERYNWAREEGKLLNLYARLLAVPPRRTAPSTPWIGHALANRG